MEICLVMSENDHLNCANNHWCSKCKCCSPTSCLQRSEVMHVCLKVQLPGRDTNERLQSSSNRYPTNCLQQERLHSWHSWQLRKIGTFFGFLKRCIRTTCNFSGQPGPQGCIASSLPSLNANSPSWCAAKITTRHEGTFWISRKNKALHWLFTLTLRNHLTTWSIFQYVRIMFELWPVFHHFFSGFPNKPGCLEAGTHLAAATFGIFRCRVLNCGSHGKSDVQFEKKT